MLDWRLTPTAKLAVNTLHVRHVLLIPLVDGVDLPLLVALVVPKDHLQEFVMERLGSTTLETHQTLALTVLVSPTVNLASIMTPIVHGVAPLLLAKNGELLSDVDLLMLALVTSILLALLV